MQFFITYLGFAQSRYVKKSQRNAENARENQMCKRAFKCILKNVIQYFLSSHPVFLEMEKKIF